MAQGTVTVFNRAKEFLADGTLDLDTHAFKIMLVSDESIAASKTPIAKTNFTECSGGTYAAASLTNVGWSETGGTATFSADNVTWSQDAASGPTNITYAIIFDDTDTTGPDMAFAMVDMTVGGTGLAADAISLRAGDVSITWAGTGIFTLT